MKMRVLSGLKSQWTKENGITYIDLLWEQCFPFPDLVCLRLDYTVPGGINQIM